MEDIGKEVLSKASSNIVNIEETENPASCNLWTMSSHEPKARGKTLQSNIVSILKLFLNNEIHSLGKLIETLRRDNEVYVNTN